jgi:hypothetical protein
MPILDVPCRALDLTTNSLQLTELEDIDFDDIRSKLEGRGTKVCSAAGWADHFGGQLGSGRAIT